MTLREMKDRVLSLIEELNPESKYLTEDPDIKEKINYVIDMKNHELERTIEENKNGSDTNKIKKKTN